MGALPYPALTIAKWLVAWAEGEDDEISNLKLQKLLYYAQGHHIARYGAPLFTERVVAWSHGPVVPAVYHAFKQFGASPITLAPSDPFSWDDVDTGTADFLSQVWNTYGGYSAGRLRNMTHDEPPWRNSWNADERYGSAISDSDMRGYFAQLAAD